MLFQFGDKSSLLLIFLVHGLVYSILLARKGYLNDRSSDMWLSIFLTLCVFYITPWTVGFAGWYNYQPYRDLLFYFPFLQLFFIGPVIFFYIQSLINPSFRFGKKDWLHLIPGILYLLYALVVVVVDKLVLKRYYFLADQEDRDFDTWYQVTGYISMIFYFVACLRYYNLYRQLTFQVTSNADAISFKWIKNFLLAFLSIILVRTVFFIISFFVPMNYSDTWWYFLSFSITFYYIAITGYANAAFPKMAFSTDLFTNKPALLLQSQVSEPADCNVAEVIEIVSPPEKKDDERLILEWKEKIEKIVVLEKLYEDPELSLTDLAKKLNTNASILSKSVNRGFGMNFNDFINHYRVEAVIFKLRAGEQKSQTLLGIAYDAGFNSKATFNRAFKKATGLSPKEWLANDTSQVGE